MYYVYAENRIIHAKSKRDAIRTIENCNHAAPELVELMEISAGDIPTITHRYNGYFMLFCSRRMGGVRRDVFELSLKHADIVYG